ncbi:receptor-like protein 9DC3 isoform X1 [Punica granatum]|uniref:Receptor-like protein 9DC3 isoform X1 n=1 Tax=Punica granatum TaxID=22663 RepID=A0A6P8BMD4_PUNGR|nr:receptor-like protein 9DC3 isoform X1 [Punica granatum]
MTRDVWVFLFLSLLSFLISRHSIIIAVAVAVPTSITSSPYSSQRPSPASECDALLQFSQSFTISRDASAYYCDDRLLANTSYPKTASWKNGTNCCSWDGVTCHMSKDYVIGLDLSCSWLQGALHSNNTLFSLQNLQRLNLAGNNFTGSPISSRFGILTGLAHLNLSGSSFSGIIPLEMISHYLSSLITLDLSYSQYLTIEEDRSFRRFISNLTQLRELALDDIDMSRISPNSLTNLSSTLTSLRLDGCRLQGTFPINIFHLPNLRILSLSYNSNLTGALPQTNWSSSPLVRLSLFYTKFHGPIPDSVGNLTSLEYLDLAGSEFSGSVPPTLGNLDRLSSLYLSGINLSGTVDFDMFARLKNLEELYLARNLNVMLPNDGNCSFPRLKDLSLYGVNLTEFPYFLSSSRELESLDLSGNKISGPIPEWFGRVWSNTLTNLDLYSNNFTGEIPSSICQLSSLRGLFLFDNRLNGTIPRCLGNLSNLSGLSLYSNNFTGEIPSSICQLSSLSGLSFSDNRLNGTIPRCLGNLSNLFDLDLSYNQLQGPLPRSLANCTILWYLSVRYNEIYDTFPHWLLNATQALKSLYLESNMFHGVINEIPLPPQLEYLSLSSNQFSGQLPIVFFRNSNVEFVDLANNNFDGPLPIPPPTVWFYSVANNKFSRDIPHQLCNATQLDIVNLSNNSLTGSIPHCFINLRASVLDLRANKLVGHIPDIFFSGNDLRTIRLSQNRLEGTLPRSLVNCKNLEVLDLSENELEGRFPYWLDTLPNLQVLDLRSNKLHGLINSSGKNNHPFPKLHIFDLSDNSFYGHLPAKYIANFIAMKDKARSASQYMWVNHTQATYQDSITVVMKGFAIELVRILSVFTTIDLSRNFFEGDIPELIGDLKLLKGLNISHNNLTGRIPFSVGNLTNLEWLDLSSNKLNGEIPRGLADLTMLSWLNLSDNHLEGLIPQGRQFDTFNHPFDWNPRLCGYPLPKACGIVEQQLPPSTSPKDGEEKAQFEHWIEWWVVAMGYGCGISFGISSGYIMLEARRPKWLVRKVERWLVRMVERKRRKKTTRSKKNAARRNHARRSTGG